MQRNMNKFYIISTIFVFNVILFLIMFSKELTPSFNYLDATFTNANPVSDYNPYSGGVDPYS